MPTELSTGLVASAQASNLVDISCQMSNIYIRHPKLRSYGSMTVFCDG